MSPPPSAAPPAPRPAPCAAAGTFRGDAGRCLSRMSPAPALQPSPSPLATSSSSWPRGRGGLAALLVVWALPWLAGCGDLSQDDLLFRAAIPPRQALAVVPPGSDEDARTGGQALVAGCDDGDLRCDAAALANRFNRLTFGLLAIVDRVVALPPTTRAPGRRVWGPHHDVDADRTFRFEMVRQDDGVTFAFCLHAVRGRLAADVDNDAFDCTAGVDDADASGLRRVLDGAFTPGVLDGAGARSGAGTMTLDLVALQTLDGGERVARALAFAFDNRDGATGIHIDALAPEGGDGRDVRYDFDRGVDGAGTFAFELFGDVLDDRRPATAPRVERVRLLARWAADRSGRAAGVVDEGDVADVVTVDQCWDGSLATTFTAAVDGATTGDEAACAFTADAVTPPG
jgi:hypothetical protein